MWHGQSGDTEDLGRFHFDFNFPSPSRAPSPPSGENPPGQEETFELSTANEQAQDLETGPDDTDAAAPHLEEGEYDTADATAAPSEEGENAADLAGYDDDDAGGAGAVGLEVNVAPERSPERSPERPNGRAPDILGGGLREEEPSEPGKKRKKLSRYGIPVPVMPSGMVRKAAGRFAKARAGSRAKINKPALNAIEQASSWFFEQMSQDLAAYSKHAGRKTIDESDVMTLMRR